MESAGGVSAIIAEPSRSMVCLVQHVLETCGIGATKASTAAETISMLAEIRPQLVVAAATLPDLDGYALSVALKASRAYASTHVVLMSSAPDVERKEKPSIQPDLVLPKSKDQLQHRLVDFITMVGLGSERNGELPELTGHVLVADDDRTTQILLTRTLERAGATVTTVRDGRAALRELAKNKFGLLLLDIEMPEIDGWQAIQRIRDHGISTPAIAVTGLTNASVLARGYAAGFNSMIAKPFNGPGLVHRCARYLVPGPGEPETTAEC